MGSLADEALAAAPVFGTGSDGGKVSPSWHGEAGADGFPARAGGRSRIQRRGLWTQDGTPTVPDRTRDLETRSGNVSAPFISSSSSVCENQPYV
ncbi:hypothetical protein ROHU_022651 [Labeo rohita]|uniref:Uncharacterized protein n=1 Tax=Labeo rohita TaxID=84645 RepID=A0A498MVK3_LABRO|nr:hypothetical protein ROHU_022651 [Labeo rohita]